MIEPWPFADPMSTDVFTTKQVMRDGEPIVRVLHDETGAWQFHADGPASTGDMMIVGLSELLYRNPTVAEVLDLPFGWVAVRAAVGEPWTRHPYDQAAGEP